MEKPVDRHNLATNTHTHTHTHTHHVSYHPEAACLLEFWNSLLKTQNQQNIESLSLSLDSLVSLCLCQCVCVCVCVSISIGTLELFYSFWIPFIVWPHLITWDGQAALWLPGTREVEEAVYWLMIHHLELSKCQSESCLVCLTLCDPRTVDCQVPLSVEFSRPKYWSG